MGVTTMAVALINTLLPVKMLERVNPRKRRRMKQRREEVERIRQRRDEEDERIQQRRDEEEERIQQRRDEEEERIQQRRDEEEERIQLRRAEEEERIQQILRRERKKRADILEEEEKLFEAAEHNKMVSFNTLSAEMLERVLRLLPPRDLKAVVLVCRRWREVGEAPALWVWVCLSVESLNIGYMPEVLDSRRLQAVRRVEMRKVSEELLQALVRHPRLKEMVLSDINLSSMSPELLAQAATHMEEVSLWRLTPQQVTTICIAMTRNSQLKKLKIYNNDLSSVDAGILARAVTQLEEVELGLTWLTPQQAEAIFAVLDTSSQMKKLGICSTNLSSVDPELLARTVTRLENVELRYTQLTPQQVTAICTAMAGNSRLKTLCLSSNNLSWTDADILARAVTRLEEARLVHTELTPQQVEAIFAALDTSSQMKILNIRFNSLTFVDPDVLARVVNKLETVGMRFTQLTRQQMTRILTQSLLTTNLKELDLGGNGLVEEGLHRQAEQVIQNLYIRH